MKKTSISLLHHLCTLEMIIIYLCLVVMHLMTDGFILQNQVGLLLILLPFLFCAALLDYLVVKNKELEPWIRITAQLLPLGIFIMQLMTTVLLYLGRDSYDFFSYLLWIFLSAPFFIASYRKIDFKTRLKSAAIGTVILVAVYLFLSTQTKDLDYSYGSMMYYLAFFLMYYIASGLKKLHYLGAVLGILNGTALLIARYFPFTAESKEYGWDYSISTYVEQMLFITFLITLLIRCIEELYNIKANKENKETN